uniref:Uncharacterized protein n=1 Tax=uncultured Thiotrichaceae bacterium TaxID=298394 RepID=A0A6S6TQF4_9GAMM|nr:MAG: Unknown protein [uncultured Thiotrichaceae bacterium]
MKFIVYMIVICFSLPLNLAWSDDVSKAYYKLEILSMEGDSKNSHILFSIVNFGHHVVILNRNEFGRYSFYRHRFDCTATDSRGTILKKGPHIKYPVRHSQDDKEVKIGGYETIGFLVPLNDVINLYKMKSGESYKFSCKYNVRLVSDNIHLDDEAIYSKETLISNTLIIKMP